MAFIGKKPTAAPLTSSDVADGIITSAKIADGTIVNADVNASAAIAGSKLSGAGISVADQWRVTADVTSSADITSNWERCDTSPQGSLSAVTESSGIFSFPSTGYWLIIFTASGMTSGGDNIAIQIHGTADNSSYAALAYGANGGTSMMQNAVCQTIIDVTDTAQVKVKMHATSMGSGSVWFGASNETYTGTTFIRLGDT